MNGLGLDTGDDLLDLIMSSGGVLDPIRYPSSGAEFTALTGLTASSLYLFDEASGNLVDEIAAAALTASGTPTFAYVVGGRRGVYYDGALDYHRADVNDVGSGSFIYTQVCSLIVNPGAARFFGTRRFTGGSPEASWAIYAPFASDGRPRMQIRDGTSTLDVAASASVDMRADLGVPFMISIQRDNSTSNARIRVTKVGTAYGTSEASCAGFGSLNTAGATFGYGRPQSNLGDGVWFGWSQLSTGVQCEGSSRLADLHRALGWE